MFVTDASKKIQREVLGAAKTANSQAAVPMPEAPASQSAFKTLLINFLQTGGDALKLDKKYKKPMRCAVREVSPQLLLTDGQFNLAGYLTKQALKDYMADPENKIKVTGLIDYMITIQNWTLELAQVD